MKREEFLSQPEVESFVTWLAANLPAFTFQLRFKSSRFVPGGLERDVQGFESIIQHYRWKAGWSDASGCSVTSQSWKETQRSLGKLREWLASAVSSRDDQQALKASLEILRWGGVWGAIPFLHRKAKGGELSAYLHDMAGRMALDGNNDLRDLNAGNVERFDAGLTKIHALLDLSGSPIYDSRVGAAIAMLYALYCQQEGIGKPLLVFPAGDARGDQIRNPEAFLSGRAAPRFSKVSYDDWARWQVRLGWIIRSVLERTKWFSDQGALPARCHAFEACLFMIGYDLRCFGIPLTEPSQETSAENHVRKEVSHHGGWVPTGHPFNLVLRGYLAFRQSGQPDDKKTFVNWLMEHGVKDKPLKCSTAQNYCFAFTIREFDLFDRSVDELELIVSGGESGLRAALAITELEPFSLGDEREKVCLVDVFIAGNAYSSASAATERVQYVLEAGYAGTEKAAKTLLALGCNVGKHFGLLDEKHLPTPLFDHFFRDFTLDA